MNPYPVSCNGKKIWDFWNNGSNLRHIAPVAGEVPGTEEKKYRNGGIQSMSEWNSEQYLKFKNQRTQPAIDLAKRIASRQPRNVLDVGCGPGNSTFVLKDVFPRAEILGVDNSADMIKKAIEKYPDIDFRLCDICKDLDELENFDVIFSNACLQWIPDHRTLIPRLLEKLNQGGVLAVQIPMNRQEPLFRVLDEVVKESKWEFPSSETETNETLEPDEYFDILSACSSHFDLWETVYYHNMPTVQAMVEWVKGTRLRPYLNLLDQEAAAELERKITERAASVYHKQQNGEFLFRFRRFFFIADK